MVDVLTDGSQDNSFFLIEGLADADKYTLKSTLEDSYMRHGYSRILMHKDEQISEYLSNLLFSDATWILTVVDSKLSFKKFFRTNLKAKKILKNKFYARDDIKILIRRINYFF